MKQIYFWISGIVLILTSIISCQEQIPVDQFESTERLPVKLFGEIRQTPATRVSDTGFANGDAIGIYVVNYNNETPGQLVTSGNQADNVKYVYNASEGRWISSLDAYYKDKNTNVDIYGYYPYANPSPVEAYPFEIAKDQSKPAANGIMGGYEASDFLWGKATQITPTAERIPIKFSHIMAGIQVDLAEGTGFSEGEWVNLNKAVLITGTTRKSTINLSTGTVTPQGVAETTGTIPYSDGTSFRAVVVPQNIQSNISLFSITVDGIPYTFSKPELFTYVSGKLHKFTITVNKKTDSGLEFKLTSESITAWENDKVSHDATAKEYVVVHCATPGQLKQAVIASGKDFTKIKNLKVTGAINSVEDYYFMNHEMTALQAINLKEVESCKTVHEDGRVTYSCPGFQGKSSLIHFVFPDKLTEIGSNAFWGTNLSGSLIIPEGVEVIGGSAFDGCSGLSGTLTLPSTLKVIDYHAFSCCTGLIGELKIPQSVTEIGSYAFQYCSGFSGNLILSENLKSLGSGAFSGCRGLSGSLTIPTSIKEIGYSVFNGCSGLNGQLHLHKDIISIGSNAFYNCSFRGELVLPENLTIIGEFAFTGNQFSGTLKLPVSLSVIKSGAFSYNVRLSGVLEIPEGVSLIADNAFAYCTQLEGVILPKSVEAINAGAFENCYQLNRIVSMAATPPFAHSTAFNGVPKDNFTVEVPDASVASYQTAPVWNEFKRIAAYRDFSISRNNFRSLNAPTSKVLVLRALSSAGWSVESKPDWVTVSPSSGTGKTEVTLTVAEQPHGSGDRVGEVVFKLNNEEYRTITTVEQYDYSYGDGDVMTLQKSTKGSGVNLVFMGDCFDALDIKNGKYLNGINEAVGYFFGVEPYKSYKDYFNVYAVFGVSDDSGVGTVNTIRDAKFGTSYFEEGLTPNTATTFSYACKAPINNNVSNSLVVMVVNTEEYAGMTYMWGDGSAIALCPMSRDYYPYDFRGIVQHEAGGHGFGKLGDEYIYSNAFIQSCICPHKHVDEFEMGKSFGWYKNLSLSGNMYDVPWSHMILHPTYSDKVDIYEGGFYHTRGVFRSEPNSCMNNNIPYYNAISRQAIVEYIKKHSGEPFRLEDFYANDVLDASLLTRSLTTIPSIARGDQRPPKYMGEKPQFQIKKQ